MFHPLISLHRRSLVAAVLLVVFLVPSAFANTSGPQLLTYPELVRLYSEREPDAELELKLNRLLTTPFISNNGAPHGSFARSPHTGEFLRFAFWNIERGLEYDAIEAIFADPAAFEALLDPEEYPIGSEKREQVMEEATALRMADVIVLNEVDWGMKRSGYRNIVADLASKLGMNYAFGLQFVELSPILYGTEPDSPDSEEQELIDALRPDRSQYKGLHGMAVLSRFPLENVRLVPFESQPYDWYISELKGPGVLETAKQQASKRIFLQKTLREVRRGGRAMLIADVIHERIPTGRATVVATHLENRTKPANRVLQLKEVLAAIKPIRNPVILAGDMNTTGQDMTPTTFGREIRKRIGNPTFWLKRGAKYALGVGMIEDLAMAAVSFGRSHADPTVKHIPFISPNPERKFFSTLRDFRFDDGGGFDMRGDRERSTGRRGNTLSNSNERGTKGFITTYTVKRPIKIIGKQKLDWIFVKPADADRTARKPSDSQLFAPHHGRTLRALTEIVEDRISDHRPMIVDLPITARAPVE